MPLAATWMDLEIIILSEVRQRQISYDITYMWNLKCDTNELIYKNRNRGASLVAQWLRVCLLMQGTRVRALVWEDTTCRGAAGPVSHNC